MKKILIIGLLLFLPSCEQWDNFQNLKGDIKAGIQEVVTPDNFDNITIAYAGVSAVGDGYYSLCERKVINKSCWQVIIRLKPYEDKAFKAYMALEEFVKRNPGGDNTSLIQIAKNAISALKQAQFINGVK